MLDKLNLVSMPFALIEEFCCAKISNEARNAHAANILSTYGTAGLISLWLVQGYADDYYSSPNAQEPCTSLHEALEGQTPSTSWWLMANNAFAQSVREELAQRLDEESATECLNLTTRKPRLEEYFSTIIANVPHFKPATYHEYSDMHAYSLLAVAKAFFPQFPQLSLPICSFYASTYHVDDFKTIDGIEVPVYCGLFKAFAENSAALKYLVCKLDTSIPYGIPEELKNFSTAKDPEWAMYEAMGLTLEEAYCIAAADSCMKNTECIALPDGISEDHCEVTELSR